MSRKTNFRNAVVCSIDEKPNNVTGYPLEICILIPRGNWQGRQLNKHNKDRNCLHQRQFV